MTKHQEHELSLHNKKKLQPNINLAKPVEIKTEMTNLFSQPPTSEFKSPVPSLKVNRTNELYHQFIECFGDSLLAGLPVHIQNDFKKPFIQETIVSLTDADSHRTGEEMLKEFLKVSQPQFKKTVSMDADRKSDSRQSFEVLSSDMSYSGDTKSERSSRSERSHSDECFMDDADLTIKATVSDPSKGIKLLISKRPRKMARERHESKRKKSENLSHSKLHDAFDMQPVQRRRKEIRFGFSTKDWKSGRMYLQKGKLFRKHSNQSHLQQISRLLKSDYRKLCGKLPMFGTKKSERTNQTKVKKCSSATISGFDIGCVF